MPTITLRPANGPLSVTEIDCGASTPKLGGTINISPFNNLTTFRCNSNDIVSITGYTDKSEITFFESFNNKITGQIPNLTGMTKLETFRIYTNLFSGPLPTSHISPLPNIKIINYGENNITGSIPDISNLTTLTNFRCNTNKHTGSIPNLTNLTNLQFFYCYFNELTGSIPSLTGLTNLQEFRCYENLYVANQYSAPGRGIGGPIPSLTGLTSLRVFQCYRNALTNTPGTNGIPSLAGLTNLQEFTCYDNMLSGSIPDLTGLNALTNFQCHDNDLTGSIPASLSNLPAIQTFNCGGNELTGAIPATLPSSLVTFVCAKNKLSSTIPNLTGLNSLIEFACDNNKVIPAQSITGVNGSIPNLTGRVALQTFRCNDTEVDDYPGTTAMPVTLGKFHAFNTNLTAAAIGRILKAFIDGGRVAGDRFINLGGKRTNGTFLTPSFTGGTIQNAPGTSFVRPTGSKTVTVTLGGPHGYLTNQLVTITSAVHTLSGLNFNRVGSTVTVTFPSHGFTDGQSVVIGDVSETSFQADFKGTFTISVTGLNAFTYTTTTSGTLVGTGMATISDNTFNSAFKGTFKITTSSNSVFTYVTSSTTAITGAGTATLRSTTTATDGYAYYQTLTEYKDTNPATTPWNVVINQPTLP